jgi:hypothetical protein
MKYKRLDFKYTPLQVNTSKTISGSVPLEQTYDANQDEYSPDYRLTPCTLQPVISIIDRDGILPSGRVNSELTDIAWYRVENGVEGNALVTTPQKHVITSSGDNAGKLLWYINAAPQKPILLRFKAKYLDSRTNKVHRIMMDYSINCKNATIYKPTLLLSSGDRYYNPLRDTDKQVISASLRLEAEECAKEKRLFVWEILRDRGQFSAITADDLEIKVSADGTSVTLDRSLMGKRICIRCRAKFSADGNPASVDLSDATPNRIVNIVRRIPFYDYDILDTVDEVLPDTKVVNPAATISDNVGEIANPTRELQVLWWMAPNNSIHFENAVLVGHGMSPRVPTDLLDPNRGAILALEVKDLDPLALAMDSDGKVFVDADGNPFIFH